MISLCIHNTITRAGSISNTDLDGTALRLLL
jgi:hypothetical protein